MSKTPNKRSQFMGDSPLFYKEPINLESGEGVWLYGWALSSKNNCFFN